MNNDKFFILRETSTISRTPEIIEKNNDEVVIKAVLQDLGVYNRNGRNYQVLLVDNGCKSPEILELQENRSWFGEYGHPLSDDVRRQVTIDNKYICHEIMKTELDGNLLKGTVSSIPTHYGREFRDLIRRGTKVAFSLRALGKLEKSSSRPGCFDVVAPFRVITYDCVILPSHKVAYQEAILKENGLWLPNEEKILKNPVGHKLLIENVSTLKEEAILVDVAKFISGNSDNVKAVQETLEFAYDNIRFSHDNRSIIMESKADHMELIIPLENYVSKLATNVIYDIFKK